MGKMTKTKTTTKHVWGHEVEEDGNNLLFLFSFFPLNQTVSDPSECVRHGSQQVQEDVEQGVIRVQVAISNVFLIYICVKQLQKTPNVKYNFTACKIH